MWTYVVALVIKTAVFLAAVEAGVRHEPRLRAFLDSDAEEARPKHSSLKTAAIWAGYGALTGLWFLQYGLFSALAASARVSAIWNMVPIAFAGAYWMIRKWRAITGEAIEPVVADAVHSDGPKNEFFDKAA